MLQKKIKKKGKILEELCPCASFPVIRSVLIGRTIFNLFIHDRWISKYINNYTQGIFQSQFVSVYVFFFFF